MARARISSALRRLGRGPGAKPRAATEADLAGLESADRRIVERALPYTMTGALRLAALIDAVRYCVHRGLDGAFAECGVWRGGSVLAMILTLQELDAADRELYLYDTFEGMTRPTDRDTSARDGAALEVWQRAERHGERAWGEMFADELVGESVVSETLLATGYDPGLLHLVAGPVERTLPERAPTRLALLRLDTDWYESTRHELTHLYPRLVDAGVLIVDDYGHWEGCRRAVDEYFADDPVLLNRIDYSGRIAVKG
ncbi:MAG: TylF/MycF/NovP-related O-methyltransferase [Solirubrobacterales bacterium]